MLFMHKTPSLHYRTMKGSLPVAIVILVLHTGIFGGVAASQVAGDSGTSGIDYSESASVTANQIAGDSTKSDIASNQNAVDGHEQLTRNIIPLLIEESRVGSSYSIHDRMEFYDIPGLSIAVIDHGEIIWVKSFGTTRNENGNSVTDTTLFQAASISKPVAAIGSR